MEREELDSASEKKSMDDVSQGMTFDFWRILDSRVWKKHHLLLRKKIFVCICRHCSTSRLIDVRWLSEDVNFIVSSCLLLSSFYDIRFQQSLWQERRNNEEGDDEDMGPWNTVNGWCVIGEDCGLLTSTRQPCLLDASPHVQEKENLHLHLSVHFNFQADWYT